MNVVITSATEKETLQIKQAFFAKNPPVEEKLQVSFHYSGVGILSSSFSIAQLIFNKKPALIIQAGIAGTFNHHYQLGKVVAVKDEILADTGVEEDGHFKDLFDLNLQAIDLFPFTKSKLSNPSIASLNYMKLDEVTGVTINEITTRPARIEQIKKKYHADIESMEGASLHYCCLHTQTPFIQIRAVSNYVGERNKQKWNFKDSLNNLAETVTGYINQLSKEQ